jgi:hypothetical protein
MRHLDYNTARALQDRRLDEARLIAERRNDVQRNRRSLRLGLAAKLGFGLKLRTAVIQPKPQLRTEE